MSTAADTPKKISRGWVLFPLAVILLFVGELLFCRGVYVSPSSPFLKFSAEEYLWLWDSAPNQYPDNTEFFLETFNLLVTYAAQIVSCVGAYRLIFRKNSVLSVSLLGKLLIPGAAVLLYALFCVYVTQFRTFHYILCLDLIYPVILSLALLWLGSRGQGSQA